MAGIVDVGGGEAAEIGGGVEEAVPVPPFVDVLTVDLSGAA